MADVAEFLAMQWIRYAVIGAMAAAVLRVGDVDDPIPARLEVRDSHGNRVDLLIGLRGMNLEALNRTPACRPFSNDAGKRWSRDSVSR